MILTTLATNHPLDEQAFSRAPSHPRRLMRLGLMAAVVTLAGCAVTKEQCDPAAMRTAGLMTKVACDFSGAYDARAQDQQQALNEALEQQALLQQSVAQLQDERQRINEGIVMQRAQRDRLVRSLNSTLATIDAENQDNAQLQSQIEQARAEVQRLDNLPQSASSQQVRTQIETIEREIQDLTDRIATPAAR
jgi:chromosome segregation ATPase